MYLIDIIQDLQHGQDAGPDEQAHLSPDVTWEEAKQLLLAAVVAQICASAGTLSARRRCDLN